MCTWRAELDKRVGKSQGALTYFMPLSKVGKNVLKPNIAIDEQKSDSDAIQTKGSVSAVAACFQESLSEVSKRWLRALMTAMVARSSLLRNHAVSGVVGRLTQHRAPTTREMIPSMIKSHRQASSPCLSPID